MTKEIILIGKGRHATSKIIPAIKKNKIPIKYIIFKNNFSIKKILDKINKKNCYFYICTPPETHFKIIYKLLKNKCNIITEKPAFTNLKDFKIIKRIISKQKNLFFFENMMYIYSKIFLKLNKIWKKNRKNIKVIKIIFLIPNFFSLGFRKTNKNKNLILYDIGIYPISLINYLNIKVKKIFILQKKYKNKKLSKIKIRIIAEKTIIDFYIGENATYYNNLKLINNNKTVISFDKIFSGIKSPKVLKNHNKSKIFKDHDCFEKFFSFNHAHLKKLQKKNFDIIEKNTLLIDRIINHDQLF